MDENAKTEKPEAKEPEKKEEKAKDTGKDEIAELKKLLKEKDEALKAKEAEAEAAKTKEAEEAGKYKELYEKAKEKEKTAAEELKTLREFKQAQEEAKEQARKAKIEKLPEDKREKFKDATEDLIDEYLTAIKGVENPASPAGSMGGKEGQGMKAAEPTVPFGWENSDIVSLMRGGN